MYRKFKNLSFILKEISGLLKQLYERSDNFFSGMRYFGRFVRSAKETSPCVYVTCTEIHFVSMQFLRNVTDNCRSQVSHLLFAIGFIYRTRDSCNSFLGRASGFSGVKYAPLRPDVFVCKSARPLQAIILSSIRK